MASVIANAQIDGAPIGELEAMSYYVIIATAGHDTTSSSTAGGMLALLEHPEELQKVINNPALMPLMVDEAIRWTSPVKHFMRYPERAYELRGKTIEAGSPVMLLYPSGNRDEEVFDRPQSFWQTEDPIGISRSGMVRTTASATCSQKWKFGFCTRQCSIE